MPHSKSFYTYGHTISFSTKYKVKIRPLFTKIRKERILVWGIMTPEQQYRYFINKYLKDVVNRVCDKCEYTFELTKDGNVHAHGLISIQDNNPGRHLLW